MKLRAAADIVQVKNLPVTQSPTTPLPSEDLDLVELGQRPQQGPLSSKEALKVLEGFDETGKLFGKKLGVFDVEIKAEQALARLKEKETIAVQPKDGKKHYLSNFEELQTLDTLLGQDLKPNLPGPTVEALRTFDKGTDANDGLFKKDYGMLTRKVDALQAYNALQPATETIKHRVLVSCGIGAGVGLGLALAGTAAVALFPNVAPALTHLAPAAIAGIGVGAVATGAALGAGTGFVHYKNDHPRTLEVRYSSDAGLRIASTSDAVDLQAWLKEQATHPFTPEQQIKSLDYLHDHVGLYRKTLLGRDKIAAKDALKALEAGDTLCVPSSIPGRYNEFDSLRKLQEIDTVRGLGINPVLPKEVGQSLAYLEKGVQPGDGLFKPGKFESADRLDAYESLEYLLRERRNVGVKLKGKEYVTKQLVNLQELNALQGDLNNTILPAKEFESIQFFNQQKLLQSQDGKALDAYESFQEMKEGRPVSIPSEGRKAAVRSAADMHELNSLEFTKQNTILPDQDYNLLQFWQKSGYRVEGIETSRAFEALQQIQAKNDQFEVQSSGRWAPANSFQDLVDLAAFEAKDSGFPNTVPPIDQDRLEYFQGINAPLGFKVGNREGRAYEGYRQLRDGRPFDVQAGGVWNQVDDPQSLHELDALLGRRVNDILPGEQYDLLHVLGDGFSNEGLSVSGNKRNSYQALQAIKAKQHLTYDFNGGDFGELLKIETPDLEALKGTKLKLDNQKEYDRYRYDVPEFKGKMQKQDQELPDLSQKNLDYGKQNLASGESHKATGESHKREGESDLSRGRSDLSWGESRMSSAQMMPMYNTVTKTKQVCDSHGSCHTETYTEQEYNWARQSAISSAQSDIDSAKRKIRQAEDDIRKAEQEIERARQEIRKAEGEISDAKQLQAMLPGYEYLLESITSESCSEVMDKASAQLQAMQRLSHIQQLTLNIKHQTQLIGNQQTRPQRPAGWADPQPRVMD